MVKSIELSAELRERVGKGAARAVRREGRIPAVIYGDKKPPLPISLSAKELDQQVQTGSFLTTLYEINVGGNKARVLPRDVQFDPVRDFTMHVDFLRLGEGATINVEIPVTFINEEESPGLKRGGAVNVVRYTVELLCPADSIPDEIVADLTGLDIGDSLHISAISLPEGVTPTITDRDFTVVTIAAPVVEVVEEEEEEGLEGEELEGEAAEGAEEEGEGEGDGEDSRQED